MLVFGSDEILFQRRRHIFPVLFCASYILVGSLEYVAKEKENALYFKMRLM